MTPAKIGLLADAADWSVHRGVVDVVIRTKRHRLGRVLSVGFMGLERSLVHAAHLRPLRRSQQRHAQHLAVGQVLPKKDIRQYRQPTTSHQYDLSASRQRVPLTGLKTSENGSANPGTIGFWPGLHQNHVDRQDDPFLITKATSFAGVQLISCRLDDGPFKVVAFRLKGRCC